MPATATPISAPRTIKAKSEHTSLPAPVTTRRTLLFTLRCTIAPPSTAATGTFPPTLTLLALVVRIIGRATLPGVSEESFTSPVLTAVRGQHSGEHSLR